MLTRSAIVSAGVATLVAGHARMVVPRGRSMIDVGNDANGANGPSVCGGGGDSQWSRDQEWTDSLLWPVQETFVSGGVIEIGMAFSAPHMGHFRVQLCNPDGNDGKLTESCFVDLLRDPMDTRWSPYIPGFPFDFFLPDNSCAMKFTDDRPLVARFRIPFLLECEHCVVRIFWQTANSCLSHVATCGCDYDGCATPDPLAASWRNGQCKTALSTVSNLCGMDCPNDDCAFEKFKLCADVKVVLEEQPKPTSPPKATTTKATTTKATTIKATTTKATTTSEAPIEITGTTIALEKTTDRVLITKPTLPSSLGSVDYCEDHISSDYDTWASQCVTGCSMYKEWCEAQGYFSGPELLDCVLQINATCFTV